MQWTLVCCGFWIFPAFTAELVDVFAAVTNAVAMHFMLLLLL